jgi:hypothetical protein
MAADHRPVGRIYQAAPQLELAPHVGQQLQAKISE